MQFFRGDLRGDLDDDQVLDVRFWAAEDVDVVAHLNRNAVMPLVVDRAERPTWWYLYSSYLAQQEDG